MFNSPYGIAVGPDNTAYVADTYNHCIRKISVDGTVATLAGNGVKGYAGGNGSTAQFNSPFSIDVDAAGNVFVADSGNNRIRKVTAAGQVTTLAGSGIAGRSDGPALGSRFSLPSDLVVDAAGNIFVADLGSHAIRVVSASGGVSTLAGNGAPGAADGAGPTAQFNAPSGIALGNYGEILVADTNNNRIRKISPGGMVSTIAGSGVAGSADGMATGSTFGGPCDLILTTDGSLIVTDTENNRLGAIK